MTAANEAPKVFISYSWSGAEHEQFVLELAAALRNHGVDAILDKWRLQPGQDKFAFMESMVTDPSVVKVLVLCDRKYKEKADQRAGGVGTESQIISAELYSKVTQTKFIPVVCERGDEGEEFLPVFMKGRIYVDMSSDEQWGDGLDQLLRQIYDRPLYPEPSLGATPDFLKSEGAGLAVANELPSALRSIREGKANREGLENLFFRSVLAEVKKQYVKPTGQPGYDEEIYQAILKTKGIRDQISEYVDVVASFSGDDPKALKPSISLLEQLGQLFGPPLEDGAYVEGWADLYRFFALEVTLVVTAALLRHERWQMLRHFFKYPYLVRLDHSGYKTLDIVVFDSYINSMDEHRKNRLRLNRISVTADMLKERCSPERTPFSELLQADVFLALYGTVHYADQRGDMLPQYWRPRTTVYSSEGHGMPIFLKAVDPDIRSGIRSALGVSSAAEMATKIENVRQPLQNFQLLSLGTFPRFRFAEAINLQTLTK